MRDYTSRPEALSFRLDGVEFRGAGLSILDMMELAKHKDLDVASPEGLELVGQLFRKLLGADFERFEEHCREHATTPDVIMAIITDLVTDMMGGENGPPSQRPSASPDGPPTTGRTLRAVSLSRGTVEERELTEAEETALIDQMRAAG